MSLSSNAAHHAPARSSQDGEPNRTCTAKGLNRPQDAAATDMSPPEVSHGRGGAGNINPDPEGVKYVDGEIVREGTPGAHGDGPFSTGRGGGGNIGSAGEAPATQRADHDVVPEAATRPSQEVDHHVGRGGAANVVLKPEHERQKREREAEQTSVADKLKHKLFGLFKK